MVKLENQNREHPDSVKLVREQKNSRIKIVYFQQVSFVTQWHCIEPPQRQCLLALILTQAKRNKIFISLTGKCMAVTIVIKQLEIRVELPKRNMDFIFTMRTSSRINSQSHMQLSQCAFLFLTERLFYKSDTLVRST